MTTQGVEEEVGRWQHAIYEACCKAVRGLREERLIDGAGEDSGDPLDFSLAEISLATCSLHDEIDLLTRERDEARELAREAGVAGMRLAGEMMEATDGWLVCLRDFGDLFLDCERAEKERDEARERLERLWRWVGARRCTKASEEPCETTEGGFKMVDCGECLPCEARKALSLLSSVEAVLEVSAT